MKLYPDRSKIPPHVSEKLDELHALIGAFKEEQKLNKRGLKTAIQELKVKTSRQRLAHTARQRAFRGLQKMARRGRILRPEPESPRLPRVSVESVVERRPLPRFTPEQKRRVTERLGLEESGIPTEERQIFGLRSIASDLRKRDLEALLSTEFKAEEGEEPRSLRSILDQMPDRVSLQNFIHRRNQKQIRPGFRLSDLFRKHGTDPERLADELWRRYRSPPSPPPSPQGKGVMKRQNKTKKSLLAFVKLHYNDPEIKKLSKKERIEQIKKLYNFF